MAKATITFEDTDSGNLDISVEYGEEIVLAENATKAQHAARQVFELLDSLPGAVDVTDEDLELEVEN